MAAIYSQNYWVPFYQTGPSGYMRLSAFLNVALQFSGQQSLDLGRSDEWVLSHYQGVWVVSEHGITLKRLPRFKENIRIETEVKAYNKIFCYRDIRCYGEKNELLLSDQTVWVLMDPLTRKIQAIKDEILAPYQAQKIRQIHERHTFVKFDKEEKSVKESRYDVLYSDIDINQHVNNTKYYDWAIDQLGAEFLLSHQPSLVYIRYNREIRLGQKINLLMKIQRSPKNERWESFHDINQRDCQIEIEWRENDRT